ncbi:GNAT family N-acetyltransferase [Actinocrispum wychmicini]|uniref:Ribosomal protein S18 acetylase RimI-like enzyme n=1 Tax=Actinocrispum wychmicini TaxID=1213861 RepID=A0A4R2JLN7_9PSEU|nr:GNAT family N-acetyltransferase [Actinocrispum wychmicini]TCO59512.1 ribosomal protein S18 acetylase RimI-like enzyme [Actinocrispum wychmicini]
MDQVRLRAAEPHEADNITALARRSKAHWGYEQEFLDRVQDVLTVRPEQIHGEQVIVAERGERLLGYYQLGGTPPDGELVDLFVEPDAIGTGLGRRLWDHATSAARKRGFRTLELESDPHAEAFYLHMGAQRVGEREVDTGRQLPVMRIVLANAARGH